MTAFGQLTTKIRTRRSSCRDPAFDGSMELSPIVFVAAATLAAAFVAALVSMVGLVISKEQKTTEFRQAWINSLRAEVAKFAAEARYIAGAIQYAKRFDPHCFSRDSKAYDTYAENRSRIQNAYYLISLHFKPADKDFAKLSGYLDGVMRVIGRPEQLTFAAVEADLREITELVRHLMKQEWERVKAGELIFQGTKYAAIGLVMVFLGMIVFGTYSLRQVWPAVIEAAKGSSAPALGKKGVAPSEPAKEVAPAQVLPKAN